MTPPKHLWSGDWESESEASAANQAPHVPAFRPDEPAEGTDRRWLTTQAPAPRPSRAPAPHSPQAPAPARRTEASPTDGEPPVRTPRPAAHVGLRRTVVIAALLAVVIVAVVLITGGGTTHRTRTPAATAPNHDIAYTELGLLLQGLPGGVQVQAVVPGSPADQAGIGGGDPLLSVNGQRVTSTAQVDRILSHIPAGKTITLNLDQGSFTDTVQIQLSGTAAGP